MQKKFNIKRENIQQLIIPLIMIIAFNTIGVYFFKRIDLTQEKRYSISSSTKNIIKKTDDIVYIKVYLDGDLPANFKRLRNAVRELLDEFRAYNTDIQYEFINPSADEDKRKRFKVYRQLASEGLAYYNVPVENKDGFAQKTIFPSAMITYRDKSLPINLMQSSRTVPTEADLNNSIQRVELNFISAIRKITARRPAIVAFAQGHGELNTLDLGDISYELGNTYNVGLIDIGNKLNALSSRKEIDSNKFSVSNNIDLLVIAKPDSAFDDKSKFIIDQFIMHGGKVIWLVDGANASMDSLRVNTSTIGLRNELDLNEMLYRYGIRLNSNLILNRNALEIGTAEGKLRTWDFFPLLLPVAGSPITENLNSVKTQFVSSLDTVGPPTIRKTILLRTDKKSRIMPTPAIIDVVDIIYRSPNLFLYNAPEQNIAVLLEGEFNSYFVNKLIDPRIANDPSFGILYKSSPTSQMVISGGDLIRNQVIESSNGPTPLPLGYDRFTQRYFDNKKFVLNSINYMLGDKDLIVLRNKDFKIRLLNKELINESKLKFQLINTILPVLLIVVLGIILFIVKKRKYAA